MAQRQAIGTMIEIPLKQELGVSMMDLIQEPGLSMQMTQLSSMTPLHAKTQPEMWLIFRAMIVISIQEATKIFAEHMTQLISEHPYSAAHAKVELITSPTKTQSSTNKETSSSMRPLLILMLLSSLLTTLMTSLLKLTTIVTRITSRLSIPPLMVSSTSRLMLKRLSAQLPMTVSSKHQQRSQAYRLLL